MAGLVSYFRSFRYAFDGLWHAFREHKSFRVEVIAAIFVVVLGFVLGINRYDWLAIVIIIFSVLVAELLNTAVETTLDYLARDHHVDVRVAKDVAAGAVLLLSIASVVVGTIVFLPYLV